MICLDTNILIYGLIPHPLNVQFNELSKKIINEHSRKNRLIVSDIHLLEFAYVANRYKAPVEKIFMLLKELNFFRHDSGKEVIERAVDLMLKTNSCNNSNDCFLISFAESYHCKCFLTFDKDFAQLVPYSKVPIQILSV